MLLYNDARSAALSYNEPGTIPRYPSNMCEPDESAFKANPSGKRPGILGGKSGTGTSRRVGWGGAR